MTFPEIHHLQGIQLNFTERKPEDKTRPSYL